MNFFYFAPDIDDVAILLIGDLDDTDFSFGGHKGLEPAYVDFHTFF